MLNYHMPIVFHKGITGMGYIGENIYISTSSRITDEFLEKAVVSWDEEKNYYDYDTNTCQQSKVCGHYTQVRQRSCIREGGDGSISSLGDT